MRQVWNAVEAFLPWYSAVHGGAGYKSQASILAYESGRLAALAFAGRGPDSHDVAVICRNTTEAINHLACRLGLSGGDVVAATVAEHDSNRLPWARAATCRYVECGKDGTFTPEDVAAALDQRPVPRLLAITGASHVTGWLRPLPEIIAAAHHRGTPVLVDAAQLAPHRPLPAEADFLAWSGHKVYAPFGAGVLVGPRRVFAAGDPFLVGGGAASVFDLDDLAWAAPPEREEVGSPNVVGAVALGAAIDALQATGWPAIIGHERRIAWLLRRGLAAVPEVRRRTSTQPGPAPAPGHQRTSVASRSVIADRPQQPAGRRMCRIRRLGSGHDQQAGLVVNVGTGSLQAGLADPEVVAAQQQVYGVRAAGGRRHHHGDHRPCRAAACPRGYVQRYGSLQLGDELLARGGRPVRPPPLHTLTISPAWTGCQGHCSRAVWPWVPRICRCRALRTLAPSCLGHGGLSR